MVKEEQQKQSRHLHRGPKSPSTNPHAILNPGPIAGGGPAPDAAGADEMGIVDPRDLRKDSESPLGSVPWRPGTRAAS